MQLVSTHTEIPDELELNREDRKNLAELKMDYPTKTDEQAEDGQGDRSSADTTHASCVKMHSQRQSGRRIILHARQNADKYLGKKNS